MKTNEQTVLTDDQISDLMIIHSEPNEGAGMLVNCRPFARAVEQAVLAKLGAVAEPLKVFAAGNWTWDGTGQSFTAQEMNAEAFVKYRRASLPAASDAASLKGFLDAAQEAGITHLPSDFAQKLKAASSEAGAVPVPDRDAVDLARAGMELHSSGMPEHIVCAELVRVAEALKAAHPAESAERAVILSGAQLLEALDFIAPDRDTDSEQLEIEVAIRYGEGHSGKGYYCYLTDCPDEGAILLDGSTAAAAATVGAPAPMRRLHDAADLIDRQAEEIIKLREASDAPAQQDTLPPPCAMADDDLTDDEFRRVTRSVIEHHANQPAPAAQDGERAADLLDEFEAEWNGFELRHDDIVGWIAKIRAALSRQQSEAASAVNFPPEDVLRAAREWKSDTLRRQNNWQSADSTAREAANEEKRADALIASAKAALIVNAGDCGDA